LFLNISNCVCSGHPGKPGWLLFLPMSSISHPWTVFRNALLILCISVCGCRNQSRPVCTSLSHRFRLVPGKIVKTGNVQHGNSRTCCAYIVPEHDVSIRLKLIFISSVSPKEWDLFFIDNTGCHMSLPDSCILNPVSAKSPENDLTLGLMVNTNGFSGKGRFELTLEEIGRPGKDTLRFEVE
jgi:hypothetical protein